MIGRLEGARRGDRGRPRWTASAGKSAQRQTAIQFAVPVLTREVSSIYAGFSVTSVPEDGTTCQMMGLDEANVCGPPWSVSYLTRHCWIPDRPLENRPFRLIRCFGERHGASLSLLHLLVMQFASEGSDLLLPPRLLRAQRFLLL